MRNYSFILMSPSGSEQLYRIGEFPSSEHAFCLAEAIASELRLAENEQWSGWTIDVQDREGSRMFSMPVGGCGNGFDMTDGALAMLATPQAA